MEQKGKKFEELNRYERAMTIASLEQRLEAMAKDIEQIALALHMSVHVNATAYGEDRSGVEVDFFPGAGVVVGRDVENTGDLFGIIEEALNKKTTPTE